MPRKLSLKGSFEFLVSKFRATTALGLLKLENSKPETALLALLTLELRIEAAQSLKDRRQVVRSLKDRLRTSFNVSVAEMEPATLWNQATIGVVAISSSRDYLAGLMDKVERAANRIANNHGAEVSDTDLEFI